MKRLSRDLAERRAQGLYRERRVVDSSSGVRVTVGGRELLSFCSNDYLGLANDTRVVRAMQRGADEYGAGSGASHLVSGHSRAHHDLELALAAFVNRPRALLFSTGYMANQGVIGALAARRDTIYEDRWNHASLVDAARLGHARVRRYRHVDMAQLESTLNADRPAGGLIATDAVFSMDGDTAPLAELQAQSERHGIFLLADDAHGIGVLGRQGRGTFEHQNVAPGRNTLLMGTLGKAFGVFGAFVAGSDDVIETLIQYARTYVYTTALPPAVAVALQESLRIIETDGERRERLWSNIRQFREGARERGLPLAASDTPIQPIVLGGAHAVLRASEALLGEGILVSAIRPPTVPVGTSRLRVTMSSEHRAVDIERLLDALSRATAAT